MPAQAKKKSPQAFEVVFMRLEGKPVKRCFKTEDELVEYLKKTRTTEAPVSFRYWKSGRNGDGTIIDNDTLDRLHRRFFGEEP